MYGVWDKQGREDLDAKMFYALVQSSGTDKGLDTGGSFGKGKGAIALASRMRTLGVYTAFNRPTGRAEETPTRRFLGVAYWTKHAIGGVETMGLGMFGEAGSEGGSTAYPIDDDEADQLVASMRLSPFEVRDPATPRDLGSTYVILEPAFTPSDLAKAIERNWWPALTRSDFFDVRVIDHSGESIQIAPKLDRNLKPFVKAYECALGSRPTEEDELLRQIQVDSLDVGTLALTADRSDSGFTFADPIGENTIIALVRNDMVIQYRSMSRPKPPFIRGVFVVDRNDHSEAAKHLARIEPVLHNNWPTSSEQGVREYGRTLARRSLNSIAQHVGNLRKKLLPDSATDPSRLPLIDKMLSSLTHETSVSPPPPPPPPPPDLWQIHYPQKEVVLSPSGNDRQAVCSVELSLKPDAEVDSLTVEATFGWEVDDDLGRPRGEPSLLGEIQHPQDFSRVEPGVLTGELTKEASEFQLLSSFYDEDWTVRPVVSVKGSAEQEEEE